MTDDTKRAGAPDSTRINVNQKHELRGWAESLGVSEERMREVVHEVGDSASRVRDHLGRNARKERPSGSG